MRRSRSGDLEFGSDSFLDIIANIVGILIILIVIAGLRAARTPVETSADNPPSAIIVAEKQPVPPPIPVDFDTPRPTHATQRPPLPGPRPQSDAPLPGLVVSLRSEIDKLQNEGDRLQAALQDDLQTEKSFGRMHAQTFRQVRDVEGDRTRTQSRITTLRSSIERNKESLASLRIQYDEAGRKAVSVTTIRHKMTPVGETVTGKELHFRLSKGRVSHVPIEDLVKQMREEVLRRKDWLMKFPTHSGIAGPVQGYSMNYIVQRQMTSAIDELRGGYGQVRIVLAGWKVQPTSELVTESADQALRSSSRFLRELRAAETNATITFWVYPDSFALYRELQKLAQDEGFRVAARPLPFGIPIAGSPNGSRSSGQ